MAIHPAECNKNTVYQTCVSAGPAARAAVAGLAAALLLLVAGPADAAPPPWRHWQTIIYQQQDAAQLTTLRRLGVTAGMVFASRDDQAGDPLDPQAAALARQGMRFYVENIATDFYAAYHRWHPDRPPDAAFHAIKALHRADPADPAAFIRKPGLSDPAWLRRIRRRLRRTVHHYAPFRPLYYSLADEPGIADLAANWDFDISPDSLAAMRLWLRGQYGSLAALNREWGTRFPRWSEVTPELTDAAVRQQGENFARWEDFKRWMDVAFARAVRAGTDAVHAADPQARAAIEGAQIPGWGGYDYGRLAGAVDVMEIYNMAENIGIARSLNPRLTMLLTISGGDAEQTHRLWRGVLRGMRGVILWDEHGALAGPDGKPGPWGRQAAPLFHALRGTLGQILLDSRRTIDPVAILYSPASERTQWLLDRRKEGGMWENRSAGAEDETDDAVRQARRRFAGLVAGEGLQGRYVTARLIEHGALRRDRIWLLLLPHAIALPEAAAAAIRRFVAGGGIVAADVVPGRFDGHGRRLRQPSLAALFAGPSAGALLMPPGKQDGAPFARAGLTRTLRLTRPNGEAIPFSRSGGGGNAVALYRFHRCGAAILALQRNLSQATAAMPAVLHLQAPAFVYDLGKDQDLGRRRDIALSLDPVTPGLLAVSAARLAAPEALLACKTRTGFRYRQPEDAEPPGGENNIRSGGTP